MSAIYLFDSRGRHIANWVSDQLHSPRGENVGHWNDVNKLFFDMRGKYLGEIFDENRLLFNKTSGWLGTNWGNYGNYGSVGSYGNPGSIGAIGMPGGWKDVDASWKR
jgi:hypothetical protein